MILVSVLLLMFVVVTPVAATSVIVDLDKTYEYKGTSVSHIVGLDVGDPSVSKVEILSTGVNSAGDGSDVRIIQQPSIYKVTRIFDNQSATAKGITVTLIGDKTTTIDYRSPPTARYYISPVVPTFKITVPGWDGNPMVAQLNESLRKSDARKESSPILATNMTYLFNMSILGNGIVNYNANGVKTAWGTFIDKAPFDQNNLDYTLSNNRVDLNSFTGDAETAWDMGDNHENTKAVPGKYFAGALYHDQDLETTTVVAGAPTIVLEQETPIVWIDDYGTHSLPFTYTKGEMGDVTLKFPNANAATTPTKIGYVLINSQTQYNIQVKVNTTQLATNAEERWDNLMPSSQVIDILFDAIRYDVGLPYTYNITAVGKSNAPDATSYSQIAITPGYGMSGNTTASQITIPEANFADINDGVYYLYLMGINDNEDIVAFAQSTVSIKSGSVPDPSSVKITSISPNSGYRNTTVSFTLSGTNFPTDFGTSGVTVNLTNAGSPVITTTINSVTSTKITGTFNTVKANVNGAYDIELTTNDAGLTIGSGLFTIKNSPPVTISRITPNGKWSMNTTVNYTITGTNFDPDKTVVLFRNKTGNQMNAATTNSGVWLVTPTTIYGTIVVPYSASSTSAYNITATTPDGGTGKLENAFTVVTASPPSGITISPNGKWSRNSTVNYTISGQNFQVDDTIVKFRNKAGTELNTTFTVNSGVWLVTATKIYGTIVVPYEASSATAFNITVTTFDGGTGKLENAFTIADTSAPTITTVAPTTSWYRNATIPFLITGKNFQPGQTIVEFSYPTNHTALNATFTVDTVTATTINGTIVVPFAAPTGNWNVSVTTFDGGKVWKTPAFKVLQLPAPGLTTVAPTSGNKNSTVSFTVSGTNFQTDDGYTNLSFVNSFTEASYYGAITSVTPTKITGTVTFPDSASSGAYDLVVVTRDGGTYTKAGGFTVNYLGIPTVTSINQTSGYKNSTVTFLIKGTNFQDISTTEVDFINSYNTATSYPATVTSVTETQITGTFAVPASATGGLYDVVVSTVDGGIASKTKAFTINYLPVPKISVISMNVTNAYKNSTIGFTIKGTSFQPDGTYVRLYLNSSTAKIPGVLTSVTSTQATGTFEIPANQPAGKYRFDLITVSGGSVSTGYVVTISPAPAPTITSAVPSSILANNSFIMTVKGTNFQSGTNVSLSYGNNQYFMEPISITPTLLNGTFTIPASATASKSYKLNVTTLDGGGMLKPSAFEVKGNDPAKVTKISTTTGYQNTAVAFTVTGTNFQTQGTTVTFWNSNYAGPLTTTLFSVSTTQIIGSVNIPNTAPTGTWYVNASSVDGGTTTTPTTKFTISPMPNPKFTSITPGSGAAGSTVAYTIVGDYFMPRKGTVVWFQNGNTVLNSTVNTIYQTRTTGSLAIPAGSTTGGWAINISTSSGWTNTTGKFTVT